MQWRQREAGGGEVSMTGALSRSIGISQCNVQSNMPHTCDTTAWIMVRAHYLLPVQSIVYGALWCISDSAKCNPQYNMISIFYTTDWRMARAHYEPCAYLERILDLIYGTNSILCTVCQVSTGLVVNIESFLFFCYSIFLHLEIKEKYGKILLKSYLFKILHFYHI